MDPELNPYAAPSSPGELVPLSDDKLSGRLRLTAIGLRLIYGGLLVILVCWIATVGLSIALAEFTGMATAAMAVISLTALLVMNVGPLLCLSVPSGYGLRSFAMATVVAQVCTGASFLVSYRVAPMYLNFLTLALTVATASLFLLFLHRIAQCIGRDDLVKRSRRVGLSGGILLFAIFPLMRISDVMQPSYQMSIVIAVGLISGAVVVMVMYANLINTLSKAIARSRAALSSDHSSRP